MSDRKFSALLSPCFLFCLGLLLLNDFFLKHTFHNWLTGKLSDFAGLFIFPLFFSVFFPRFTRAIYFSTALLFMFWKSPYSQPLIDLWNSQHIWMIGRTVDYTDLLALCCLPLSYRYYHRHCSFSVHQVKTVVVSGIAVFAFAATSIASHRISYFYEYQFNIPYAELVRRIELQKRISHCGQGDSLTPPQDFQFKIRNSIPVRLNFSFRSFMDSAFILISGNAETSKISLLKMQLRTGRPPTQEQIAEAAALFEKEVIEPVRKNQSSTKAVTFTIWACE